MIGHIILGIRYYDGIGENKFKVRDCSEFFQDRLGFL